MRWRLLLISVVAPLLLWAALPLVSQGEPTARSSQAIQKKIEVTRSKIGKRKGTERVLTQDISRYNRRIETLQQRIDRYNSRQQVIQSDLEVKQARLVRTQNELRSERRRLARLRARLTETRGVLSERLVQLYKADKPDLVTVILNSHGFADLVERGDFLARINKQDRVIVRLVKSAKKEATSTAARLDTLERDQQTITERILARRNEIAQVKQDIIDTKVGYDKTKDGKASALSKVRSERQDLEGHLKGLEKEQAKVQAALQAPAAGSIPTGSFRGSGGPLTTPTQGRVHEPLRPALGSPARGHRHRRTRRDGNRRRGLGEGGPDGTDRWVRQLHLRPAQPVDVHVLRAPVGVRDVPRGERASRAADRLGRQHRQLHRPASAFRGPDQRDAREPDAVPVGAAP